MIDIVNLKGVKSKVYKTNFRVLAFAVLAFAGLVFSGCEGGAANGPTNPDGVDSNEVAATVNGKEIKLVEVERVIKQQGRGQEAKLSQLELTQARLQVLERLIQSEVLYQKAEKEGTVPTDEDITAEINKLKTNSGLSQEAFDKQMQEAGFDDASFRESIKKELAANKLIEKITGKIEPPKDNEIEAFYNGNKEAFVKKKGVKLGAIVVDPADLGTDDKTKSEADAVRVGNEIINRLKQGEDFAKIAREESEDQSRLQGGDLGYISEEEMKKSFPPQVAATFMNPDFKVGQILPTPVQGKFYIFKLQERSDKDEDLTLDSQGVRQEITTSLINARKQLLSASYAAIAMNEANIENYLAKKVFENPNDLSGARPASVPDANSNANTDANANTDEKANANSEKDANANSTADANKKEDAKDEKADANANANK